MTPGPVTISIYDLHRLVCHCLSLGARNAIYGSSYRNKRLVVTAQSTIHEVGGRLEMTGDRGGFRL